MERDLEPLPTDIWFERIEMIRNGELRSTENALRHALHLLQLTPLELRPKEYGSIDEESYEALLAGGEYENAARILVSAPTLSVVTSMTGDWARAGIRCSLLDRTIFGEGPTVADAIVRGWANCILMLRSDDGPSWLKTDRLV
jgi:hypothetical protein